jgi:hypothetical protein
MSKTRVSIFGGDDTDVLDVRSFAPKTGAEDKAPPAEQVRAVAQAANFKSREPTPVKPEPKANKRSPRRYRTGRNVQLSVKARAETVDAFYTITEATPGWVLGYTLQRAIEALQRELKQSQ